MDFFVIFLSIVVFQRSLLSFAKPTIFFFWNCLSRMSFPFQYFETSSNDAIKTKEAKIDY